MSEMMNEDKRTRESPRLKALEESLETIDQSIKEKTEDAFLSEEERASALKMLNDLRSKIDEKVQGFVPSSPTGKHYVLQTHEDKLVHLQLQKPPTQESHGKLYKLCVGHYKRKEAALWVVKTGKLRDADLAKKIF